MTSFYMRVDKNGVALLTINYVRSSLLVNFKTQIVIF